MFSSFKKDFEATSLAYSLKFSKNKGGRTTLTIAFLLSFDLRDYPLKIRIYPFGVQVDGWIFPGLNEVAVLLPESFGPISSEFAPSASLLVRDLSCNP